MRRVVLIKIVSILYELTLATECDKEPDVQLDDGTMGLSSDFNWLGLLQVFLNDGDDEQVVVTGIILVKPRHAIGSADDIVRIPSHIFQNDTRAMFIAEGNVQMSYLPKGYVVHPEYKADTFNSIALLELDIGDDSPLIPICFSSVSFDFRHLYLTGFTDENKILEKMFYRILYTDREECEEFYEKEGLVDKSRRPIWYVCGKWQIDSKPCVWDNGMALVSNSSGWFKLIGFSVHGPGCGAPARFINMLHYTSWIRNVTRNFYVTQDDYDYLSPDYNMDLEYVPIHRTFTDFVSNLHRKQSSAGPYGEYDWYDPRYYHHHGDNWWYWNKHFVRPQYVKWPFPVDTLQHYRIEGSWSDSSIINIVPFDTMYEDESVKGGVCNRQDKIVRYQEEFYLNASNAPGTVTYKFTTYDLSLGHIMCVELSLECKSRTPAVLWFKEENIAAFLYDAEDMTQPTPDEVAVTVRPTTLTNTTVSNTTDNNNAGDSNDKKTDKGKRDSNRSDDITTDGNKKKGNKTEKYKGNITATYNLNRDLKYRHEYLKLTGLPNPILTYELSIKYEYERSAVLKFKMYTSSLNWTNLYNNVIFPDRRRAFKKVKSPKRKKHWKFAKDVFDKTVRQAALVVDHNVALETASRGTRRGDASELILMGCWLTYIWSTRYS